MAETANCLKVSEWTLALPNLDEAKNPCDLRRNFSFNVDLRLPEKEQTERDQAADDRAHLGYPVRNRNRDYAKNDHEYKSERL